MIENVRWKFAHESGEEPLELRQNISDQIDNWWIEFFANRNNIIDKFQHKSEFDVAQFMLDHLQVIHPNIYWEFGPAVNNKGHRFVITPETRKDLRPLVDEILKRAPDCTDWEFYSHRIPESYELAIETVKGRTGGIIDDLKFTGKPNGFNTIDLTFYSKRAGSDSGRTQVLNDAFVAMETILGEEVLDRWVGEISVKTKPGLLQKSYHLIELKSWFDTTIDAIKRKLPDKPYYEFSNSSSWTMFKGDPPKQDDYYGQTDIFVGKSVNSVLWRNGRNNAMFYSDRYSKHNEIFCYLKMDGTEGLDEEHFEDKSQIEDVLDSVLVSNKAGCFIGGGTGLRYSYIDFAITDFNKAIELIKHELRKGMITKRSSILFYDSELSSEWIGIWDDSPRPLLPDFEEKGE